MLASIAGFALGCSAAALLFALQGEWCFIVPPCIGLCSLLLRDPSTPPQAAARSRA